MYVTPIKFLVFKVNGIRDRKFNPDTVQNDHILFFYKRGRSIYILGLLRHFLWVRLRILVMDEMSLEV